MPQVFRVKQSAEHSRRKPLGSHSFVRLQLHMASSTAQWLNGATAQRCNGRRGMKISQMCYDGSSETENRLLMNSPAPIELLRQILRLDSLVINTTR
jgi:hypothetical protein